MDGNGSEEEKLKNKKDNEKKNKNEEEEEDDEDKRLEEGDLKIDKNKQKNIKEGEKSSSSDSDSDKNNKNNKINKINKNIIEKKPEKKIVKKEKKENTSKKDYITNIHIIKQEPQSKNENGFLKDHIDTQPKSSYESFLFQVNENITENIDILEENKNELKKHEEFFNKIGYVLTEKSCERMAMLIHFTL